MLTMLLPGGIARAAAWLRWKAALRLRPMIRSQSSPEVSRKGTMAPVPAQLTSVAISPAPATSAARSAGSVMSQTTLVCPGPGSSTLARSARITACPLRGQRIADGAAQRAGTPRDDSSPLGSCHAVPLLDLHRAAVDGGQHPARIARDHHVDDGRPVALGEGGGQRALQVLGFSTRTPWQPMALATAA
jgi:hypothetical protein